MGHEGLHLAASQIAPFDHAPYVGTVIPGSEFLENIFAARPNT
jgi:hypothetical protein